MGPRALQSHLPKRLQSHKDASLSRRLSAGLLCSASLSIAWHSWQAPGRAFAAINIGPGGVLPDGRRRDAHAEEVSMCTEEGLLWQFPSLIYRRRLRENDDEVRALNEDIAVNFRRLMVRDEDGKKWSSEHYAGGYTSYFSLPALQKWVPPITQLEEWVNPHVEEFRKRARLAETRPLFMTDCWANVMGDGTTHAFHQHNRSTISGTYYVETPEGCSGLRFEDPRLDRTVAAQRRDCIECPAASGYVILFESWQRHTVPINRAAGGERIGVSFNYHWRYEEPSKIKLEGPEPARAAD
eukprot:TRINITY_DN59055_c0_g1_i1.p1 TRINITY_DN59055_c0_g1~~TRINITY_DN59055_c0_g1_i1.p1  ORF type:complete len:297 (-),score=52.07 TRINITY_DN59055_c0_g1_i1:66-956(-)